MITYVKTYGNLGGEEQLLLINIRSNSVNDWLVLNRLLFSGYPVDRQAGLANVRAFREIKEAVLMDIHLYPTEQRSRFPHLSSLKM